MPDPSAFKKFVETGRVVLLKGGPHAGKTAVIVEIIDHNRAVIDGPTTGVPRQSFPYKHLTLTKFVVKDLPRGAGTPTVKKYVEKSEIDTKWAATSWAKKRELVVRRKKLGDFERFKVMITKRHRRDKVRKTLKKA
ncbi:hypothetical protein FRC14_006732 [Serendipita sp. 396]|nr:hypothetical protein FRC14_006732 [Serendipita sp. 396]KAG8778592.1 hypothetical protein FRC15_010661 [Serendipita sp. 397]KAG8818849.1 hypothetical protein FRC18_012311 [Serendipita sp. 400]KAG8828694.1 hypothetical protein FRC19_000082 [Serendipita sp. 401]KAG8846996.1 hypothetical protein FRB91_000291 [Serendipita sp. 411]KAG9058855.1 hypothetical protein FS842_000052 [Serendipita sp. 407]